VPHLVADGVTKTFGVDGTSLTAVSHVSLELDRGEFVSITGHSGSGKTTLLSILGGLSRPSSGRVLFNGTDLYACDGDALAEYRCESVGFVFQFASLLTALTAKENLLLPVRFRSSPRRADDVEARALELLGLVGLREKADAYPSEMSGGQQRRVAIARAFMNEPELILADEPTGDLDEETEAEVMKLFRTINERSGTTLVLVTHDTALARQAGRLLQMHRGSLREPGREGSGPEAREGDGRRAPARPSPCGS
jgi:putative ABC transport system ATP-binding protein/lipoprotein-releasing system ATP-binding protein